MNKRNVNILKKNLVKIVKYLNQNNDEIWYRVFPHPLLESFYQRKASPKLIAQAEKEREAIIYIHIPFCRNRCDYCSVQGACDINKVGSKSYINCLKKELKNTLKANNKRKILAVYMGGGTPSLIEPQDFKNLFKYIRSNFSFPKDVQFSTDACPSDVTQEMAQAMIQSNINRVCLGVQTFNQEKLKLCNRHFQKNADVYNAVEYLRKVGINNISFDMICGLDPKETVKEFLADNLDHLVKLSPENVALYPLQNYGKFPGTITKSPAANLDKIRKVLNSKIGKSLDTKYRSLQKKKSALKGSDYYFLRRSFLTNVLGIGLGAKGDCWVNSQYLVKVNANKGDDILGYKNNLEKGVLKYNYYTLPKDASLRRYLAYNFNLKRSGVYRMIIEKKLPQSLNLFEQIISNFKDVLNFSQGCYNLSPDYRKILPFKTKNEEVNYFIFAFCYLWSEKDQEILFKKLKLI